MDWFSNLFGKKENAQSWEERNAWDGSGEQACPRCGEQMTKRYNFSGWWCNNCQSGLDDDDLDDDGESLSVYDAALIWASHGRDEDYMFGYSEDELEDALS